MGDINDQGEVGACVSYGLVNYLQFLALIAYGVPVNLAERFIYSHRPNSPEEGMYIRDGLDIALKSGCPVEALCPATVYGPGINMDDVCDSPEIATSAAAYKIKSYARVQSSEEIKQALQTGPVVVGVLVTEAWITGSATITGHIPDPGPNPVWIGGHCVCLTGMDDATGEFEFKNSWYLIPKIKAWGDGGYGYFTYGYIGVQLVSGDADAWVMVFLGGAVPPQPPDPVADLKACLKKARSLKAILACIVAFLKAKGWLATVTLKPDGSADINIRKK